MDDPGGLQDRLPPEWVPASLDPTPAHQVHRSAQYPLEFVFHINVVEETPPGIWAERDKDINIALRPEVVAQHGIQITRTR